MFVRFHTVPSLFNDIFSQSESFDSAFPLTMPNMNVWKRSSEYPYVNVAEYKNEIQVVAEIPGVPKENVRLQYHDGMLTISGERKAPEQKEKSDWLRQEILYGSFSRTIQLPEKVNAEKISAEHSNGVLRVTLPKAEEVKPKDITIR